MAPDFTTTAFKGGQPSPFKLSSTLKTGKVVVLYFFPSAYTSGCTVEAHEFAVATPEFAAMGATVIGVTAGRVEDLAKFSKEECRDAFPVAGVSKETIKAYDAVLAFKPRSVGPGHLRHRARRQDPAGPHRPDRPAVAHRQGQGSGHRLAQGASEVAGAGQTPGCLSLNPDKWGHTLICGQMSVCPHFFPPRPSALPIRPI
jgi:peroxiredoxin